MEEQPEEQPTETSDDRPKIFKNINGWIAGATGVLVALGGLYATYDKMFGGKSAEQQDARAALKGEEPVADRPASPATEAAASPAAAERNKIYTGDLFADGKFGGGAMSLKHDGDNWILTADQAYEYEQLATSARGRILAYNADYGSYLTWPIDGGLVEESLDKKKNWSPYAKVSASEPASN